jgi:putative YhdH/YhfP family quinone oxidoreductase
MDNIKFRALVVDEISEGKFESEIKEKYIEELPAGEIIIKVAYSTLNYKDALSFSGHKGITKKYPHTPGIDASGVVVDSLVPEIKVGEQVLVTGYDLGMNTSGGFQEYIRVPSKWVVKIPSNLDLKTAMVYGTAGFTAGLAIHRFQENGITPDKGKVLVTGASGAVGTMSIAILNKIGYEVVASSGKPELKDFLHQIGAKEVITREDVNDLSNRPLLPRRWKAAIDNVGGGTLVNIARSLDKGGAIAVVGIVSGDKFELPVYPFILRGIALLGIESAETEMPLRLKIWDHLNSDWHIENFDNLYYEISLEEVPTALSKMLKGKLAKKNIVKL